ncbi:MAG: hypothetical protein JSS20_21670, partial [Proteobacteria bacterium]|nr:hypothetical protein [Pseudomonadota bacterium]
MLNPIRYRVAALVGLLVIASADCARADSYVFAGGQTTVIFSWDYAGISRNSGRIVGAEGMLDSDPKAP